MDFTFNTSVLSIYVKVFSDKDTMYVWLLVVIMCTHQYWILTHSDTPSGWLHSWMLDLLVWSADSLIRQGHNIMTWNLCYHLYLFIGCLDVHTPVNVKIIFDTLSGRLTVKSHLVTVLFHSSMTLMLIWTKPRRLWTFSIIIVMVKKKKWSGRHLDNIFEGRRR